MEFQNGGGKGIPVFASPQPSPQAEREEYKCKASPCFAKRSLPLRALHGEGCPDFVGTGPKDSLGGEAKKHPTEFLFVNQIPTLAIA
jgi:hypothetical protein